MTGLNDSGALASVDSFRDSVINHIARMQPVRKLAHDLSQVWSEDITQRFNLIRKIYKEHMDEMIFEDSRTCPYFFDWIMYFTPIERMTWADIRNTGIPFFPQYPALKYFFDFADPVKRIEIEADGKAYHDTEKDKKRDFELRNDGWLIFRVKGRETFVNDFDFEPREQEDRAEDINNWLMNSSEGVVCAIAHEFYGNKLSCVSDRQISETLRRHSYVY